MQVIDANGVALHVQLSGDPQGVPVVFANSLGTDLRLWDALVPAGLRLIRYDKRGHGLSACPAGPYTLDDLTDDAAALLDALGLRDVIFVGLSIGGLIGQNLAARRPDLVRALVLANSAAKMGDAAVWADRIAAISAAGIAAMETAILDRWFGPTFRASPQAALWGAMLSRTPQQGYLGCCAAIAAADLTASTRGLRLPVLAIGGGHDRACPPEHVAATAALIAGAQFHLIADAGHLPCVETPAAFADILTAFIKEHSHV